LLFEKPDSPVIDHNNFIDKLKDPKSPLGITDRKQFENYVSCLRETSQADSAVTGILVNSSADGKIRFLIFETYDDLALRLGLIKQESMSGSLNQQNEHNQNQKKDSGQKKGFGMNR
jgi:hypothetical protein